MPSEIQYFDGNTTKYNTGKQLGIFQTLSPESTQEQDIQLASLIRHSCLPGLKKKNKNQPKTTLFACQRT